jgi:SMI1 / KNR4 family (SUKH-1)
MIKRKSNLQMYPTMHGETSPTTTTDSIIDEFEKSRGIRLPNLYRTFLKETNGGIPDRRIYPITGMIDNPHGGIQCFFGFNKEIETDNIDSNYDFYAGRIPHEIVMIASNGGGDYVCLDLRSNRERVVFWDKRPFWGTGKWQESDLYQVADTFQDFLTVLKPRQQ